MPDYKSPDESRAEIAMLSHEVYRLSKELDEQRQRQIRESIPDKYDPFDNPTEYKGFNGDYSKILPRIKEPAYEIPLEPDYHERKGLRKYYSIGSWCMIIHFLMCIFIGKYALLGLLQLLASHNPGADSSAIITYMRSSSMAVSLNMLVYLVFNVVVAFIGMKLVGIKHTSLIRTKDFGLGKAVQYCLIAMLLWGTAFYLINGLTDVFDKYGIDIRNSTSGFATSTLGIVISTIYSCIIAPITEELLFRGALLRSFSKANQRFAIFATAFFFGISHGNIVQFISATLLGIFLAHITLKHGSIIPSIIVHIFINSFVSVLSAISQLGKEASVIAYLVTIALMLMGFVMLLVFHGSDSLPATTPKQSKRGIYVAISSFPFVIAVTMNVFYIVYALMQNMK